jgi:thymidylate synthase (FAD)
MTDITVNYIDHMGNDLSVVNAARVSFDNESEWETIWLQDGSATHIGGEVRQLPIHRLSDRDAKLISYLAKHNHKSPFNHTFASFRVKAPIFVARQLVKHEYMPWNEVSRRYVDSEPEFYTPSMWRKRADNVKQGSSHEALGDTQAYRLDLKNGLLEHHEMCANYYQWLLDEGVCPEQARMVLPQSMLTEWIWSGTLFAIAKMYNLRIDSHTQYETRQVAKLIGDKMAELYPVSWAALTAA